MTQRSSHTDTVHQQTKRPMGDVLDPLPGPRRPKTARFQRFQGLSPLKSRKWYTWGIFKYHLD